MRKTKIVCTVGPASDDREVLRQMIEAGMNVARLNFSHGTHEEHQARIDLLKELREEMGVPLPIMLDTRGPEVRIGRFEGRKVQLKDGAQFTLTTKDRMGSEEIVSVNYANLPSILKPGYRVLLDDGNIELMVESVKNGNIACRVLHGGPLSDHKSANLPDVCLDMPYLSEADQSDMLFAIQNAADEA